MSVLAAQIPAKGWFSKGILTSELWAPQQCCGSPFFFLENKVKLSWAPPSFSTTNPKRELSKAKHDIQKIKGDYQKPQKCFSKCLSETFQRFFIKAQYREKKASEGKVKKRSMKAML
jgi:hypothetical protein